MTYRVHIQYRDGERYTGSFEVDKTINHPPIGMLPGGIEREVEWIKFELTCGDCNKPVLVTPRISLPEELVQWDELNYYYYLDGESAAQDPR